MTKNHALDQRTAMAEFHFHWYDPSEEFTDPPVGDPNGHQHEIVRNADREVTGFAEAAGHTHDVIENAAMFDQETGAALLGQSLKDVEIFHTGTWNGDKYSEKDLDDIVAAFEDVGYNPPVKLGHKEESGDPAYGWVEAIRRVGETLVADFRDLPDAIYDAIRDRRYDAVSSEIFFNLKRGGKTFRRALKAVALLGAEIPAVAGLKPLGDSFAGLAGADHQGIHHATIEKDEKMADDKHVAELTAKLEKANAALAEANKGDDKVKIAELTAQVATLDRDKARAELAAHKADNPGDADPLTIKRLQEQIDTLTTKNAENAERHRRETVEAKVRELRIPSLREHVAALYDLATADPDRTVKFTVDDKPSQVSAVKVLDDLVARLNKHSQKLFTELGKTGDLTRDDQPRTEDAGAEVDNLTKAYMQKHDLKGHTGYSEAQEAVLADPENRDLRDAYLGRT